MAGGFRRVIGGSAGGVLVRLAFLSLLVGAFMAMLGLTPERLFDNLVGMFEALWNMGFEAFGTLGMWLVYGAMIVIPIWIVVRLLAMIRGR